MRVSLRSIGKDGIWIERRLLKQICAKMVFSLLSRWSMGSRNILTSTDEIWSRSTAALVIPWAVLPVYPQHVVDFVEKQRSPMRGYYFRSDWMARVKPFMSAVRFLKVLSGWHRSSPQRISVFSWGRCVIFLCNDFFPEPLGPDTRTLTSDSDTFN